MKKIVDATSTGKPLQPRNRAGGPAAAEFARVLTKLRSDSGAQQLALWAAAGQALAATDAEGRNEAAAAAVLSSWPSVPGSEAAAWAAQHASKTNLNFAALALQAKP